ncbi:MAG: sodium:solute symporter family protein, partial [Desulfovibrio sp.]|nr:sodium:solute symporter family protein [Desulfovibrio sp.]
VGSAVLVSYVALVRFGLRSAKAAWFSFSLGFGVCLIWYLMTDKNFAILPMPWPSLAFIPPFFVGFVSSLLGWFLGWHLDPKARENSNFWPQH